MPVQIDKSLFKDEGGRWLVLAIFWEWRKPHLTPVFTIKPYDRVDGDKTYPSLKKLYMEYYEDPTEYTFAEEVLGGWEHWQQMAASWQVRQVLDGWREEAEVKRRSMALKSLIGVAMAGGEKSVNAAKYVAENGWSKRSAGRPTKEEVDRERKIAANIKDELTGDAERIGMLN